MSLATFHAFDKENGSVQRPRVRLAMGCGGCGCGCGGCGGCWTGTNYTASVFGESAYPSPAKPIRPTHTYKHKSSE